MEILIQVDDEFVGQVDPAQLEQAVQATLLAQIPEPETISLTLTITDNQTIRQLNADHRGLDTPTDVLSFPNQPDPDFPVPEPDLDHYLGDLIIAYPVAQAQANAGGHTAQEELVLLAVHGMLHLLGFDHKSPEEKAAMWAAQSEIMVQLGLAHIQPTES